MPKYTVQWNYSSGLGSFSKGDVVELTEEDADAFNRDSPGVLKKAVAKRKDRQLKSAKTPEGE